MFGVVLLIVALASCSAFSTMGGSIHRAYKGASSLQMGNIVENLQFVKHYNRFTFKTLYKCIAAAGLEDALSAAGPFTIFAPTDAAFAELPAGTIDALLADIPKLKGILTYHVVEGALLGEKVKAEKKLKSLNGKEITIDLDGDRAYTDDAKVLVMDKEVDNGVIHIIDQIMMP